MKIVQESGKRKRAIARSTLKTNGTGKIKINGVPIDKIEPELARMKLKELLIIARHEELDDVDIEITVSGGGITGQMDASQIALSRVIVKFLNDPTVTERIKNYDRSMLAGDSRQVEPKKWGGRKARARFQKSFR